MKLKYKIMLGIITVGIGICLMTYQSYALWVASSTGGENIVNVGCFEIEYTENTNPISLYNSYPVSDQKGMSGTPYTFTIKNTCSIDSAYQITMNTFTTNQIAKEKMKYAFYKSGENKPTSGTLVSAGTINTDIANLGLANLETSYIIGSGQLRENESATYHYYMWIDSNAGNEVMGQRFEASIKVVSAATKIGPTFSETVIACGGTAQCLHDNASKDPINLTNDDPNQNVRYIGSNPNNYVQFNNELWRIVGVFLVENESGSQEQRMKLIRESSIGDFSWHPASGESPWNNWSKSEMQKLLNQGAYYNRTTGIYYNNTTAVDVDFSNNGLTAEAKNMIGKVVWNLGSMDYDLNKPANEFYAKERGTEVYGGNPASWTGEVGLMYPSDYAYATSGGSTTNRTTCLQTSLENWSSYLECASNDWLNKNSSQWTITPCSLDDVSVVNIWQNTNIGMSKSPSPLGITPTVFLKANVKIQNGTGSYENPYILNVG